MRTLDNGTATVIGNHIYCIQETDLGNPLPFKGKIGEIAVYYNVLNPEEIQNLYSTNILSKPD